ncbi:MAG TPA: SRPBCC family protein [Candidatus Dormibacteraeota bacterium]|jgi:uncharacterized protein YndB with AHSA1/START domain
MKLQPIELMMSAEIRAPIGAVWSYMVDWEGLHRWMSELSSLRITSTQREGVGVEGLARVRIGGVTTTDKIRVTDWDPPVHLTIAHLGWVSGSGAMVCEETARGTVFTWTERLQPPLGPAGWIGMQILRPLIKRTFVADVRRLKALAEFRS